MFVLLSQALRIGRLWPVDTDPVTFVQILTRSCLAYPAWDNCSRWLSKATFWNTCNAKQVFFENGWSDAGKKEPKR